MSRSSARIVVLLALVMTAVVSTACASKVPRGATGGAGSNEASTTVQYPDGKARERAVKMAGKTEILLQHQDNAVDPSKYDRAKMDGEPSDIPFFKPKKDEGVVPRDYPAYDRKTFKFLALMTNVIAPQSYYMLRKGGLDKALEPKGYKAVELLDSGHVKILPNLYLGYYDFAWVPLNVLTEYWSGYESMNQELWSTGDDYVVIGNSYNGGISLIAPPSITDVKDLAGKKVGIMNPSFNQEALLNKKLRSLGMATESAGGDVGIEMGSPGMVMNDMMEGRTAAVMAWGLYEKTLREKLKYKELLRWDQMGYGKDVPYSVLVVRRDILEKHPDIVQTVVQHNYDATKRAIEAGDYKKAEYPRAERYWSYNMGTPRKLDDAVIQRLVLLDPLVNETFLRDVHAYMTDNGQFKVPYAFDRLVNTSFQERVRR